MNAGGDLYPPEMKKRGETVQTLKVSASIESHFSADCTQVDGLRFQRCKWTMWNITGVLLQ